MIRALFSLFLAVSLPVLSQIGPRTWQDHLSVNSCNSVTKLGSKIYASYGNGLIFFEESELSPQTLNKINLLNDVGVRLLRANAYRNEVLVVYDNCNLDIVDANGTVRNYPDFKLKTFSGRKIVNEVTFDKQLAYLACGFGIVVFDMEKMEIRDTYYIGPAAAEINVLQVATNNANIFAATEGGLYMANKSGVLGNYKNWHVDSINMPKGPYCGVVNVADQVLCCYARSMLADTIRDQDTIYQYNNGTWGKYGPMASEKLTIRKMGATYEELFYLIDLLGVAIRNVTTGKLVLYTNTFNGQAEYGTMRDCVYGKDHTTNLSYWVADYRFGLYQTYGYYPYFSQNKVTRNGTNREYVKSIDVLNGVVAVAPSSIIEEGRGNYLKEGLNFMQESTWSYMPVNDMYGNPAIDLTDVLMDRTDNTRFWTCSWTGGVFLFKNKKLNTVFTPSNTTMDAQAHCSALSMDEAGNLWVATSDAQNYANVIKKDGKFVTFRFNSVKTTRQILVDRNNYVWLLNDREGGVTVFKHDNFSTPVPYDPDRPCAYFNYRVLSNEVGNGNLQSKTPKSILEDADGKIWIGTTQGISIFYNPTNLFACGADFDAQPIKIVQDGNVELLLSHEIVTAIVADGAGNKWVGTQLGGAYCFSPDGMQQLYHFTKGNSALYSNTIIDINYDAITGDVYIGTDRGIQSFRSIIIEGGEEYSDVHAYPNPVKPGYSGSVLVRGLVDESVVKITDESGNLVWETKATGGQAEWPVKTLSGARVTTGVYIIYASTTDGVLKAHTKVLVVN